MFGRAQHSKSKKGLLGLTQGALKYLRAILGLPGLTYLGTASKVTLCWHCCIWPLFPDDGHFSSPQYDTAIPASGESFYMLIIIITIRMSNMEIPRTDKKLEQEVRTPGASNFRKQEARTTGARISISEYKKPEL